MTIQSCKTCRKHFQSVSEQNCCCSEACLKLLLERTIECKICNKKVVTNLARAKNKQFCSVKCRGIAKSRKQHRPLTVLVCAYCEKEYKRLIYPSTKYNPKRVFCSQKCHATETRVREGCTISSHYVTNCKFCNIEFGGKTRGKRPPNQFCSTICGNRSKIQSGQSAFSSFAIRKKYLISKLGKEEGTKKALAEQEAKKNVGAANGMFGRKRKKEVCEQISKKVREAYADGRLTPPKTGVGTKFTVGHYKGVYFRSSYEYVFLKK